MAGERGRGRRAARREPAAESPDGTRAGALAHTTTSVVAVATELPGWVTLLRAPNPGPMTLDGTNTWVLHSGPAGAPLVVIDPGPDDEPHLRRIAETGPVEVLLATHGHPDHVDGVDKCRRLTGAPLRSAGALPEGEPYRLGDLSITTLPTPGHTGDSVCFLVEAHGERVIFTGDTILGRGTTVVAWPDGDLGDYLASLARLAAYQGMPALPGHGPALADCGAAADHYLRHRHARLAQVRAAVAAGAGTPAEVVARVYADVDPVLWGAAEWTVRAQLAYLNQPERESAPGPPPLDSL